MQKNHIKNIKMNVLNLLFYSKYHMNIIGNLMFITTNAQHIDLMTGGKIKVKAEIESSI